MKQYPTPLPPRWAFVTLWAAGLYNLAWGGAVILFPNLFFDLSGLARPLYPEIWQCVGMIVALYGIAYVAAAFDPVRFWPIILVGLLGKILGPIGYLKAIVESTFNLTFGLNIVFNDLIWWVPFGLILLYCVRELQKPNYGEEKFEVDQVLSEFSLGDGSPLNKQRSAKLIFLRHFGCSFCREVLAQVRAQPREGIILVHMSSFERGEEFFAKHGLAGIPHIADPEQRLYRAFELGRSSLLGAFGWDVLVRGVRAGLRGHGVGPLEGDGFQLPGVVEIQDGKVIRIKRAQRMGQNIIDASCAWQPS